MLVGYQSWAFPKNPIILSTAVIGGPMEGRGPLADDFDLLHSDLRMQQKSWEQAERMLLDETCAKAIEKAGLSKDNITFFIAGDLMNQIISSSFAARTLSMPYLGIFGACSTSMEGLALASLMIDADSALYVMTGTVSHNAAAEKHYRYPTEYGAQKPPTAQWTVTAGGAAIIAANDGSGNHPVVTRATVGRVVDMGLTDPFNMGAAMAPAAFDTLVSHFRDFDLPYDYYDLIITGDLGKVGHRILLDLCEQHDVAIPRDRFADAGMMVYGDIPDVWSGGSGCGCSASVAYGYVQRRLREGSLKRVLMVATGALLSPISYQQKDTIPCIAHAAAMERIEGSQSS
ncbi:stage V sporulation protein AD [Alicyclobacillus hesperidum URH17-3-68]|uniref:stage V sporulation protein AD n=1 Tax=Alicyclobacillus hesperidum TaxID=89784 RepID=UPI000281C4A9|nr:stage V sporulation protein AD [Alicyclobacillus hesperidum]EJY54561.1 stage V sporulation protein AD [Alicyclobacillus hesperidum URH17-3-68]